jgi:GTPase SAR1 family protein
MSSDYDYLLKIVGNAAVGKSSLLLRFCDGKFNEQFFQVSRTVLNDYSQLLRGRGETGRVLLRLSFKSHI